MILLPDKYWEIRKTENRGRGLFAKKDILKGTVVGDYLGRVLRPENAIVDESNFYLMYYHDRAVIVPDLKKPGAHLINHSCFPNGFLYTYKGHTLAFTLRKISVGEELTIPYLLAPLDKFCDPCPHICQCGSLECTGTMHLSSEKYKKWRKLNEAWAKKTKRQRIAYGRDLPKLSSYPKKIPGDYIREVNKIFAF